MDKIEGRTEDGSQSKQNIKDDNTTVDNNEQ